MKSRVVACLIVCFGLTFCNEKDSDRPEPAIVPKWSGSAPVITPGATSADLVFQTDVPTVVLWVVSSDARKYSLQEVREVAVHGSNTAKEISGTLFTDADTRTTVDLGDLTENTRYKAYVVAQNPNDSSSHTPVNVISFTTFGRQDTLQFTSKAEERIVNYLLYRPEETFRNTGQKFPIAFFLTGFGEVGTPERPIAMINNGSLTEYIYNGNDVPMMVMSIQHTREKWNNDLINESIDHALAKYPVDEKKMYLIGMSGGAFGCWAFAEEHPERLAAIVPISGLGDREKACNLRDLAIWSFHNAVDSVVNPGDAKRMIKAIEQCNPVKEVKFKVFPDAGHNAWRRVFNPHHEDWKKSPGDQKLDLYGWLISKSRD
jgi:predicted peptidase